MPIGEKHFQHLGSIPDVQPVRMTLVGEESGRAFLSLIQLDLKFYRLAADHELRLRKVGWTHSHF
jgi:hypothetical protein